MSAVNAWKRVKRAAGAPGSARSRSRHTSCPDPVLSIVSKVRAEPCFRKLSRGLVPGVLEKLLLFGLQDLELMLVACRSGVLRLSRV
jgi:hypothetical protein